LRYQTWWDKLGITLSALCLVHCIGLPILIASGSLLALSAGADEGLHQWLLWAIAPVAVLAVLPGWRRHGHHRVIAGMAVGLGLIGTAAFAGNAVLSAGTERLLTLSGGLVLVASHWVNLKLCKSCPVCREEDRIRT
jgi:hypothetical protein